MENTAAGETFKASCRGVPSVRRRHDARLAVSRVPLLEPSGVGREGFYQQKLLLNLPWYCPEPARTTTINGKECLEWTFEFLPPTIDQISAPLERQTITLTTLPETDFSFEKYCKDLESLYTDPELGVVCMCCAGHAISSGKCDSCRYATGWHRCNARGYRPEDDTLVWKAGTLHSGHLDIQRCLFNLHRKNVPTNTLEDQAAKYVNQFPDLVTKEQADKMLAVIRGERGEIPTINDTTLDDGAAPLDSVGFSRRLTKSEMVDLLAKRVEQMKAGGTDNEPTDQWRVYFYIIEQLANGDRPLRLMIQAGSLMLSL